MNENSIAPWLSSYGNHHFHLDYPERTISEQVLNVADEMPSNIAYSFMGRNTRYSRFKEEILRVARSLKALGVREGDVVTISMPNSPQAVLMFYAVNHIGAIASMIHPLSAEGEIAFYLRETQSSPAMQSHWTCSTISSRKQKRNIS